MEKKNADYYKGQAEMLDKLIKFVNGKLDNGQRFISQTEMMDEFIQPENTELSKKLLETNNHFKN